MSHLTVAEKEHWKSRIGRRIDQVIESIYAAHPDLKSRIAEAARSHALSSLGIAELQRRLDTLEQDEKRVNREKEAMQRQMFAVVIGKKVEDISFQSYYPYRTDVNMAIEKRQAVHEDELLARDPHGQRIMKLRREKEELLDTVWLATSGKQIKELWQSVAGLLSDEPTELQSQALRIAPVEDASRN